MRKSIFTILLTFFIILGCDEKTKNKRIRVEDNLTSSQLEMMKELKGYKLGTEYESNGSFVSLFKSIKTSVGGLDGTIKFSTTNQNIIYKMEFISNEVFLKNDERDRFVNAIKNRYNIPKINQWGNSNDSEFVQFINQIEYRVEFNATIDSDYLKTLSKFSMTDSNLEKHKDKQNQEKANSDF